VIGELDELGGVGHHPLSMSAIRRQVERAKRAPPELRRLRSGPCRLSQSSQRFAEQQPRDDGCAGRN
jgi:hypothetical protein